MNFTHDSIIKGIESIEKDPSLRLGRESFDYDLIYEGKKYPPILVLSEANKVLGGDSLISSDFGNSTRTAFKYLVDLGFQVERKKVDFFDDIQKFLQQVETGNLGTSGYKNKLMGLEVKVSFGKGNQARIPWIAFLGFGNTVQFGIYPVYLYYKDKHLLVLAYGVSETNISRNKWNSSELETISSYFKRNNLGNPDRYGLSYVYKVYNTLEQLDKEEINNDLTSLLHKYIDRFKEVPSSNQEELLETESDVETHHKNLISLFLQHLKEANIFIDDRLAFRFICSLLSKPFVILTGLSGSGKTKLAQAFTSWICQSENQYCIVPVGADWTNREPLFGFPNSLKDEEYVKPENRVLDLMIEATKNRNVPYFLILDEMNLSHVERYFADFLSVMESKDKISLHAGKTDWHGIPNELSFPTNLFIIGTVNIDETTYMFSPKVLDRANVIEFKVTFEEMALYLQGFSVVNMNNLRAKGSNMASTFLAIAQNDQISPDKIENLSEMLLQFFKQLKRVGAEFGYRSASEIRRFVSVCNELDPDWALQSVVDAAIMQKLLPKVHGSRRKLEPVLKALAKLCLENPDNSNYYLDPLNDIDLENDPNVKYPISLDKILRMNENLASNGFTSYAEA